MKKGFFFGGGGGGNTGKPSSSSASAFSFSSSPSPSPSSSSSRPSSIASFASLVRSTSLPPPSSFSTSELLEAAAIVQHNSRELKKISGDGETANDDSIWPRTWFLLQQDDDEAENAQKKNDALGDSSAEVSKGGTAVVRRITIHRENGDDNSAASSSSAHVALKEVLLKETGGRFGEASSEAAEKTMNLLMNPKMKESEKPKVEIQKQRCDRARMEFEVLRRCGTSPFVVHMLACDVDANNLRCRFLLEHCDLGDLTRLMSRALRTNSEAAAARRAAAAEKASEETDEQEEKKNLHKRTPRDFICFSEHAVRFVAAHALEALAVLHRKGFVYRDMKPENLLVRANGHVVLCDFDLSCPISNERKYRPVSDDGEVGFVGILEYLAPEVIRKKPHTPSSDIYQVGVLMYELFVGRSPFRSWGAERTFHMIQNVDIEYPADLVPLPSEALVNATSSTAGAPSLCHRNTWSRCGGEEGSIDAVFASCPFLNDVDVGPLRGGDLLARTDIPWELRSLIQ